MSAIAYLDASAIVRLVIDEPESQGLLRWYHESERVVTSRIGVVETRRAVARRDHDPDHLSAVLDRVEVFELDEEIGRRAGGMTPSSIRTLDAIHIATALAIPAIDAFVTYDDRQAAAARSAGLPVVRPA
ncbi:MAG: type II toxin-antitoxin system VapC family toxin [Candidatus Limnocylindrales bacterium]